MLLRLIQFDTGMKPSTPTGKHMLFKGNKNEETNSSVFLEINNVDTFNNAE